LIDWMAISLDVRRNLCVIRVAPSQVTFVLNF
jgi:hypothetical protein